VVGRWLPACTGLVALGSWGSIIATTGETDAIPVVVALSALISFGSWYALDRQVTLTDQAVVMRSCRGTTTIDWAEIASLQRRMDRVWILTSDGWYGIPLRGTTRPRGGAADAPDLGDAIWLAWLDRRAADWDQIQPRPWSPSRDLRGRAVLRPPVMTRMQPLTLLIYLLVGTMIPFRAEHEPPLLDRLGTAATCAAVLVILVVLYHLWSRVTIDDDEIISRSLTGGVARLPRDRIVAIHEQADRLGGNPRLTRLSLRMRQPVPSLPPPTWWQPTVVVKLVAPATADSWVTSTPDYHRAFAWLHDELLTHHHADPTTDRA
jgi:hypothetical protein